MVSRSGLLKIAAVLGAVGTVVAAWALGVFEQLAEPSKLAKTLVDLGAWGYVAFIVAYTLIEPLGLPGTLFVMAAALIWPWPIAFALSMIGTMGATVLGFSFARWVARDWVSTRIPPRFARYNDAIERRGFLTVFALRSVFWMSAVLHAFFGVSRVHAWTHFWASLTAYLVPLFLISFFGQRVFDVMKSVSWTTWLAAAGAALLLVGGFIWYRRRCRAQAKG
jgi:LPXTG-motif cell wall-anchored protein